MAKPTYYPAKDMKDVIYWNAYVGHHFFDKDTMEFFGSRVESGLYRNNTFLTSEDNFDRSERLYTVRYYNPNTGHIDTVGDFQPFKTRQEAKEFASRWRTEDEEDNL